MKDLIIKEFNENKFIEVDDFISFLNEKSSDVDFKIEILKELLKDDKNEELIFQFDHVCKYVCDYNKLQNVYEDSEFYVDEDDEHEYLERFYEITESEEFIEYFIEKIIKEDEIDLLCYLQYFFNEEYYF